MIESPFHPPLAKAYVFQLDNDSLIWLHVDLHVIIMFGTLNNNNKKMVAESIINPASFGTLHSRLCFPPKDPSHAQKPIDSNVPQAVVLHDFPAGKDRNNCLMELWRQE